MNHLLKKVMSYGPYLQQTIDPLPLKMNWLHRGSLTRGYFYLVCLGSALILTFANFIRQN